MLTLVALSVSKVTYRLDEVEVLHELELTWHSLMSLDWNEFMNYMLIENTTLNSMKQEHFTY